MNYRTIGVVELNSIALGIHTADEMSKAATVDLVMARPTCPGRFLVMVAGDTGAVKSSVEAGREIAGATVVDWFVLPSIHPDVLPALSGTTITPRISALGVIETYTVAACIVAADAAAKSGMVDLIEIRFAAGLAGKSFVTMTGDVGSVKSSVASGIEAVGDSGPVHSHVVIPSPSEDLKKHLQ
ncbi:MAG: BMC domain-containing protein [Desulfobacterales bacterium]|nr:BMC domain-containing protein [Desulfobacterales bacterium]